MKKIDVELLIPLIKERPVIWDKTAEVYKNKVLRQAAWREICIILNDGLEEKNKTEVQEFGRAVLKKWTHIRDNWFKDNKKRKDKKPYKYNDQLSFLNKVINIKVRRESGEVKYVTYDETKEEEETINKEIDSDDDEEETDNVSKSGTENSAGEETIHEGSRRIEFKENLNMNKLRRKQNEGADETTKFHDKVNKPVDEDSHLHFFKSLLHITSTFDADETLQFQAGVIGLLQNIKKERRSRFANTGSEIFVCQDNPLDNTDVKYFKNS